MSPPLTDFQLRGLLSLVARRDVRYAGGGLDAAERARRKRVHAGSRRPVDKRKGLTEGDYAPAPGRRAPAPRAPVVLVWNNLNTYVSRVMRELISGRSWLTVH